MRRQCAPHTSRWCFTVHTARILLSPSDPAIFHEWTATLCRGVERTVRSAPQPAKLSPHLGYSQATWVLSRCSAGETRQTAARSDDKIKVVLVWQPKPCQFQCTFHRGRHNVHICKQLDGFMILDIQCTQVWSGEKNM